MERQNFFYASLYAPTIRGNFTVSVASDITALPAIMQYSFSPCPLLSKLSDLRMYLIAAGSAVLQSPDLTAVTLIDEPEVSLHPELLRLLADLMREASERTQLIVATHSDRLIRFLKPEEVLVCDSESGFTTMTWGNYFDLEKWLEDYSLDQIWAMNLIGGRP